MKIAMVTNHSCIRVHKIALPLIERGHEVHLMAKKTSNWDSHYKTFSHYQHIEQFLESARVYEPYIDLWHVHNEPSWYVYAIKEISNKPVVLDVHDTFLTRTTPEEWEKAMSEGKPHVRVTAEERASFQMADALNFVSNSLADAARSEFKLEQPFSILPSYVPRMWYKYHFKEWMGDLVYEGRVTIPAEHEGLKNGTGANYCDYTDLAKKAQAIGINLHLYPGRGDQAMKDIYEPLAMVHPGYPYNTLLDQISRHDWGVVGNTVNSPQWHVALPNKMFDYMAAGVPSVCFNATEAAKMALEHGYGIVVESMEQLAQEWARHRECREKLIKCRQDFAMDSHIHIVEDLYKTVGG